MTFFNNLFNKNKSAECTTEVDFNVIPHFEKNDLQGKNGTDGKSITIINSYINPDGNTVIKFSDNSTVIVNKGNKGDTGDKGDKGNDGESITILSTSSEVGSLGTTCQIDFSDGTSLTFFIEKGEKGNDGTNGIYITNVEIDFVTISPTYGHLFITLSDSSIIDAGYVLASLTGTAGGELNGTYPSPSLVNDAVIQKVLNGLSLATGSTILATDTIIQAFGKLQKQINNLPSIAFTAGSVLFGNGTGISQNNTKFFWDNTSFKFKLTDSSLQLLNSTLLGGLNIDYKTLSGVATLNIDQLDTTVDNWLKLRTSDNSVGSGKSAGLLFGLSDGTDTSAGQIGLYWNSPNKAGGIDNILFLQNLYGYGRIKIDTYTYTEISGIAINKSFSYTFSNTNAFASILMPYNILRFNYGGSGIVQSIELPSSLGGVPVPDNYIVIIKALNNRSTSPTISISATGATVESYTLSLDKDYVTYLYNKTTSNWEIINQKQ